MTGLTGDVSNNSLEIFPWNENLSTGIPEIDEQHKELVHQLNKLATGLVHGDSIPDLDRIFDELAEYAVYHFRTEDDLWHQFLAGDAWETEHKKSHENFVADVVRLKNETSGRPLHDALKDVLSYLIHWLAYHILDSDKRMSAVVRALQSGKSLAQAKREAHEDLHGREVLINTVLSMYDTLASRTMQLVKENLERVGAERKANALLKRSQLMMHSTPQGIHILDEQGNILEASDTFCRLLGYTQDEVLHLSVFDFEAKHSADDVRAYIKKLMNSHARFETVHRRKDGTLLDVEIIASGIEIDGTKCLVAFSRDITDRKKTEQALVAAREAAEKSNQAKSQFLTLMSHELRTPLNGILGFAQLIEGEHFGPLNKKQHEFISAIFGSAQHLHKLINDILELSKIEAGRTTISLGNVDLAPLIKSVVVNLEQLPTAAGIDLFAGTYGLGLPAVRADRVRLAQCLFNLGSNAIKYNRPGGSVTFAYSLEGEWVRISVVDTGIGIPQDRQAELFQAFNRLGAEQKAIEGTGVGLALTRGLIELMGGKIGFTSTLGKGSHFWLDIPVFAASPKELHPTAEPIVRKEGKNSGFSVLYVEDNPSNRDLMRHVFATREGVRLIEATNGAEGLAMARQQRPDLIILDINLPDVNGVTLLKQLKNLPEFAATPVLALSANAMACDVTEGLEAGFFDYITKPFHVGKFLATVDAALSTGRRHEAADPGTRQALVAE